MAKRKTNEQDNQQTNDSVKGCLSLIVFFTAVALLVYTCSDSDNDDKLQGEITSESESYTKIYKSPLKSKEIVNEVHSKIFNQSEERKEIPDMTLDEITEIYQYLCIERWNTGGQIGMRWGTDYEKAAENLNIPVSKLKAADNYYNYQLLPELSNIIRIIDKNTPNISTDDYNPLTPTAYCGMNTIIGSIGVYGQKKNTNFKEEAKKIAVHFASELPEWVTGFKLHFTMYNDTILQTRGSVDIGFLWRAGGDIQVMNESLGTYGYQSPTENNHWHNNEWNNLKTIQHPTYRFIKRQ